ncbi:MAG: hypothetical protein LBH41_02435 [Rickettsiales bacterium]|jgi:hypothetical protein|nr:hypothetical protein [Rickettsiales bacterium]
MKKTLAFIVALLASSTVIKKKKAYAGMFDQAKSPIEFGWEVGPSYLALKQTGVRQMRSALPYLSERINTFGVFVGLDAKAYDTFRLFASIETFEDFGGGGGFQPYESIYTIGAEAKWNMFVMGLSHDCTHPIINAKDSLDASQNYYKEGANTKIYIRIRGGFGW